MFYRSMHEKEPIIHLGGGWGSRVIINQDPSVVSDADKLVAARSYLPLFISFTLILEEILGFRHRVTSFLRDSPSHHRAQAIDLAPDVAPGSKKYYAVFQMSDPVLYKRKLYCDAVESALRDPRLMIPPDVHLGAFIEPDHIHLQVNEPTAIAPGGMGTMVRWPIVKDVYPDSRDRYYLPEYIPGLQ